MPQSVEEFRKAFNSRLNLLVEKKGATSGFLTRERYDYALNRLKEFKLNSELKKTSQDYRLLNKFVVFEASLNGVTSSFLKDRGTNLLYVSTDEVFDTIRTQHLLTGHGARDITNNKLKETHANITKEVIQMYVDLCETCALKKRKVRKSIVVKPIISNIMNSRCQVDLIDMQSQPDDDFKWICNYQDHLTKFVILCPHKTKQAVEVAFTLQDIFCVFGSPNILQSDNGREFANKVVEELVRMWPGCKIVHGKPRHSQSQVRYHSF